MNRLNNSFAAVAVALACAFAASPALADKDKGDKHDKHEHKHKDKHKDKAEKHAGKHKHKHKHEEVRVGGYFSDDHRHRARSYYAQEVSRGHCPPGLAKKNNGCMPPGQAKKYAVGQPLPAGVVYYPVPQPVLVQLPPAPAGHKYVRVAADILLIAVGSSMVIDAISDLSQM